MISLIHVTARGLYPFTAAADRQLGMYDLLAQCLQAQTCQDFEVICVDAVNPIPRHELTWWLKDRVRFVRPRETPWTRLGVFAAASARNSGLAWARGDTVVSIDDCYTFNADLLERVEALVRRHRYPVISREPAGVAYAIEPRDLPPEYLHGGLLTYPLGAELEINGWDERWDGVRCREDWDHFRRLRAPEVGVRFVADDPGIFVVGHEHAPLTRPVCRCWPLAWELARMRHLRGENRGNVGWTADELAAWQRCPFASPARDNPGMACSVNRDNGGNCVVYGGTGVPCTDEARAIILDYESRPQFDLVEARRQNGVA